MHFDPSNTKVVGTSISASLLELGRVTAAPDATFHILRHVANDDKAELAPIDAALKSFGLEPETQEQVWSILRGIRHLVDGEQGPDKDSVGRAAGALGLKRYALSRALSHRSVRGIATARSPEEVVAARYGLVRTLYGRLFEVGSFFQCESKLTPPVACVSHQHDAQGDLCQARPRGGGCPHKGHHRG